MPTKVSVSGGMASEGVRALGISRRVDSLKRLMEPLSHDTASEIVEYSVFSGGAGCIEPGFVLYLLSFVMQRSINELLAKEVLSNLATEFDKHDYQSALYVGEQRVSAQVCVCLCLSVCCSCLVFFQFDFATDDEFFFLCLSVC